MRWVEADFPENAGVPSTMNVKRQTRCMQAKKVYILGRVRKVRHAACGKSCRKSVLPSVNFFLLLKKSRGWSQQLKAESRWLLFTVEIRNVFWKNVTSGCHANASRAMRLCGGGDGPRVESAGDIKSNVDFVSIRSTEIERVDPFYYITLAAKIKKRSTHYFCLSLSFSLDDKAAGHGRLRAGSLALRRSLLQLVHKSIWWNTPRTQRSFIRLWAWNISQSEKLPRREHVVKNWSLLLYISILIFLKKHHCFYTFLDMLYLNYISGNFNVQAAVNIKGILTTFTSTAESVFKMKLIWKRKKRLPFLSKQQ